MDHQLNIAKGMQKALQELYKVYPGQLLDSMIMIRLISRQD